jgi:trehalose 6-phosphate synthase
MRRALRFLVVLVTSLALLTVGGYWALTSMTKRWFVKDLRLRSQLAATAARQSLLANWTAQRKGPLIESLLDITRDERIMSAAACTPDGKLLAATEGHPSLFSCWLVVDHAARTAAPASAGWSGRYELPSGLVELSAEPLAANGRVVGYVLLVQDLSFLGRRDASARRIVLLMFGILAAAASAVTLIAARVAWRGWNTALRRALSGKVAPEFLPIVRDVSALVERLAHERLAEARTGPWDPERLRATLKEHLQGERVVVLANREPYIHEAASDGTVGVLHPASGLVTALEPVLRACSGVWVAHGSGTADRAASDEQGRVRVPPGEESYVVRRVWLSEEEEAGYYYGFSNEGLWPLCHAADTRPIFRAEDWAQYVAVNQKFADAVCQEVDSDDPIILVQDYHFALAPRLIRKRLPRATILAFWHVPWPNAERLGICPWREEILTGLLGANIVGFHTQQHCNNFLDSVDAYLESRIDRESNAVVQGSRRTLVRPYPISIEWPVRWLDRVAPVDECRSAVRRELGLAEDALLGVGVDRLDYTKGIEERLNAVDALLTRHPDFRGRFVFAQLAAPSRTKIVRYRELNDRLEGLAAEINARWSRGDYRPIVFVRAHHEPTAVFRMLRAADVCYVSSLHDGMNLVAKEFVAARDDEQGVLVLSQFTGAARDLPEALIVNPYDLAQASEALATALRMPVQAQRERLRAMRKMVSTFNVYRWAGRMLIDAAEVRRRDRVVNRLSATPTPTIVPP